MQYLTGQHALNIKCSLDTCGDWHTSALQWDNLKLFDSDKMFFKDYGIEQHEKIPNHEGGMFVANHIRAVLDLLELGNFAIAQGMNKDYICNPSYDMEIFNLVYEMNVLGNWEQIDKFMESEYLMKWVKYKQIMEGKYEPRLAKTTW